MVYVCTYRYNLRFFLNFCFRKVNSYDYFITKNTRDFINKGKELGVKQKEFEEEFNIKVRELDECFIEELKNTV